MKVQHRALHSLSEVPPPPFSTQKVVLVEDMPFSPFLTAGFELLVLLNVEMEAKVGTHPYDMHVEASAVMQHLALSPTRTPGAFVSVWVLSRLPQFPPTVQRCVDWGDGSIGGSKLTLDDPH